MPIYAYACGACGQEFELRQSFSAEPEQPCPQCDATAQRQIQAVGVIYKGSGFYTTDYARKSTNPAPAAKSEEKSSGSSSSSASSGQSTSGSSSSSSSNGSTGGSTSTKAD